MYIILNNPMKSLMANLSKKALAGLVEGAAATVGTILMKNMITQQNKSAVKAKSKENQSSKPDKKDFKEVE